MSSESDGVELSNEDKRTLKELLADYRDGLVSRREVLGAAAVAMGGASFAAGRASADQPDGNPNVIGTQNDRQDLWADQIDANSVDTVQVTSDSLQKYRAYHDGSDTVVVNEAGEVARNTDAATALQTAIDQINSNWETSVTNNEIEEDETIAVLTGGMDEFELSSSITVKDGIDFRRFRFDASGFSSGFAVTFGGPDDTFKHRALTAANVYVRDSGDNGIRFRDVSMGTFQEIVCRGSTFDGITCQTCLLNTFIRCESRDNGGVGWRLTGDGDSGNANNANTWVGSRALNNDSHGFILSGGNAKQNVLFNFAAEQNGNFGIRSNGGTLEQTKVIFGWGEGNGNEAVNLQGDQDMLAYFKFQGNSQGQSDNVGALMSGTNQRVYGPLSMGAAPDTLSVEFSTDCHLIGVDPSIIDSGGEGTRTTIDGVGENAGDPSSTGQWNGNGREGVVVVDTSNNVTYHYRDGTWV